VSSIVQPMPHDSHPRPTVLYSSSTVDATSSASKGNELVSFVTR
jgi:hypothetical protein